mgnify:CR=1 FL=1
MVRLDAVGYAIKQAGTSCFMEPATFAFIAAFAAEARVEQVMQAWADQAPLPAIFPVLLELVSRPPGRVSVEDWRYEVTRLLAMCAGRDRAGYVAALGAYVGDAQMASVAEEVEDWLAEEA